MAEANINISGTQKGTDTQKGLIHIGQSFVPGREPMANLSISYAGPIPCVQIYNGTTFVTLDSTLNNNQYLGVNGPPVWAPSNEYGYTMYLGKDLFTYYEQCFWYLQYGIGATHLGAAAAPTWRSTVSGSFYSTLLNHITTAFSVFSVKGINVEFDVCWDQGYADATVLAEANAYETNLNAFIAAVNAHILLFQKRKPFWYINRIASNYAGLSYAATVRTAQANVVAADTIYRRLIDIDSAPLQGGNGHPNDAGNQVIAGLVKAAYIADH